MTSADRDYRQSLTLMSNTDLLRAYGQAVLDNDGPGSRGFFQQQSIASELLRRMESYENLSSLASPQYLGHSGECRVEKRKGADPINPCGRWMIGDRVRYTSRYVGRGEVIDPVAGTVTAITDDGVLVQWDDGGAPVELRADQLIAGKDNPLGRGKAEPQQPSP